MTVVPVSFQLTAWIPAWWQGLVGGDDLADLVGPELLTELRTAQETTAALGAFCPALGVAALPGPKPVTEAAVAAGEATILLGDPGAPSRVLIPSGQGWVMLEGGPSKPVDLDLRQADRALAEAVVAAEHGLRETGARPGATPRRTAVRPLPPDADNARRGLLVRAATLWTAVSAVPESQRTTELTTVLHCATRAALAAYAASSWSRVAQRRFA